MKLETEPITDDEWLLRRVRFDRFRTNKVPLISPNAFEPRVKARDIDYDGISLYREACLESVDEVLATIDVAFWPEFGIVKISVALMKTLGLTPKYTPDDRVRGHVVLKELNADAYLADKPACRDTMLRLAEMASLPENIVRRPTMTNNS